MTLPKQAAWKAGFALLVLASIAFAALPDFRAWILSISPALVFLLCPLSMFFCMKMMNGKQCQKPPPGEKDRDGRSA